MSWNIIIKDVESKKDDECQYSIAKLLSEVHDVKSSSKNYEELGSETFHHKTYSAELVLDGEDKITEKAFKEYVWTNLIRKLEFNLFLGSTTFIRKDLEFTFWSEGTNSLEGDNYSPSTYHYKFRFRLSTNDPSLSDILEPLGKEECEKSKILTREMYYDYTIY